MTTVVHTELKLGEKPDGWREKERVTGGGTKQQQKSVNPSIQFLLRFQHSQSFPGRQRLNGPPPSCTFIPGSGLSLLGWCRRWMGCNGAALCGKRLALSFKPQQKRKDGKISKRKISPSAWMLWAKKKKKTAWESMWPLSRSSIALKENNRWKENTLFVYLLTLWWIYKL